MMENKTQAQPQTPPVQPTTPPVMKKFETKKPGKPTLLLGLVTAGVVLLGIGAGWLFSGKSLTKNVPSVPGSTVTQDEAGVEDEATFPDTAKGMLVAGGIDGEGTHHLEREGGPSKNVYLTSTVIDLEGFVGREVEIWGQTIAGQTAGWLMDVGKVKVVK